MSIVSPEMYAGALLREFTQNFFKQLLLQEQSREVDFSYLLTKPSNVDLVSPGRSFQIMTIGGTTCLSYSALIKEGLVETRTPLKTPVPVFRDKNIFLEFFLQNLLPSVDVVALNFGFPIQNFQREGRLDAVLLHGTKEHDFIDLFSQNIGQAIESYILQKTGRNIKLVVANDIVYLLASAEQSIIEIAAVIVGTGFNLGFVDSQSDFVNLESGSFAEFTQTETGVIIDKNSSNPGKQLFEKEVSGAYLFKHYNILAKQAGLKPIESTVDLNDLAKSGVGQENVFARAIFERSAALVACQLAGLYYFRGEKPMQILLEGGVILKCWKYTANLKKYLQKLEVDLEDFKFIKTKNSLQGVPKFIVNPK